MTEIEIKRSGALWTAKDGTPFSWNEEMQVFEDERTGEVYKLQMRITDDIVKIKNAMIIVRAMETLKNAYDQVLFIKGNKYIADKSGSRYFIFNEMRVESPFTEKRLKTYFEIL